MRLTELINEQQKNDKLYDSLMIKTNVEFWSTLLEIETLPLSESYRTKNFNSATAKLFETASKLPEHKLQEFWNIIEKPMLINEELAEAIMSDEELTEGLKDIAKKVGNTTLNTLATIGDTSEKIKKKIAGTVVKGAKTIGSFAAKVYEKNVPKEVKERLKKIGQKAIDLVKQGIERISKAGELVLKSLTKIVSKYKKLDPCTIATESLMNTYGFSLSDLLNEAMGLQYFNGKKAVILNKAKADIMNTDGDLPVKLAKTISILKKAGIKVLGKDIRGILYDLVSLQIAGNQSDAQAILNGSSDKSNPFHSMSKYFKEHKIKDLISKFDNEKVEKVEPTISPDKIRAAAAAATAAAATPETGATETPQAATETGATETPQAATETANNKIGCEIPQSDQQKLLDKIFGPDTAAYKALEKIGAIHLIKGIYTEITKHKASFLLSCISTIVTIVSGAGTLRLVAVIFGSLLPVLGNAYVEYLKTNGASKDKIAFAEKLVSAIRGIAVIANIINLERIAMKGWEALTTEKIPEPKIPQGIDAAHQQVADAAHQQVADAAHQKAANAAHHAVHQQATDAAHQKAAQKAAHAAHHAAAQFDLTGKSVISQEDILKAHVRYGEMSRWIKYKAAEYMSKHGAHGSIFLYHEYPLSPAESQEFLNHFPNYQNDPFNKEISKYLMDHFGKRKAEILKDTYRTLAAKHNIALPDEFKIKGFEAVDSATDTVKTATSAADEAARKAAEELKRLEAAKTQIDSSSMDVNLEDDF